MTTRGKIIVCTSDKDLFRDLKNVVKVDLTTSKISAMKDYIRKNDVDTIYIGSQFADGDINDCLRVVSGYDVYIRSDWNSSKFNELLAEHAVKRYIEQKEDVSIALELHRNLKGSIYLKDMVDFWISDNRTLKDYDELFDILNIKYNKSIPTIQKAIRYYIETLFNDGSLDGEFDNLPSSVEFIKWLYQKTIIEHYKY